MAATGPPRRGPFMNRAGNSQPRQGSFQARRAHGRLTAMKAPTFATLSALALTACSAEPAAQPNQANTVQATPAAGPQAAQGKPVTLKSETPLLSWEVSWPAEVNAIPALEKLVRGPAEKDFAELTASAKQDQAERARNGFDFNPYDYSVKVEVAGQTPRLLSLTSEWMNYTGGAHPNHGTDALLWDRAEAKQIVFADLLTQGTAALEPLLARTFCRALNEQRRERRGPEDSAAGPDDPFSKCPGFDELVIIPKSEAAGPLTTILIHADPYVAGPYVEGDYDVEIPVNERILAALKPQYRASFADPRYPQ